MADRTFSARAILALVSLFFGLVHAMGVSQTADGGHRLLRPAGSQPRSAWSIGRP